jgi:hypothetical protein
LTNAKEFYRPKALQYRVSIAAKELEDLMDSDDNTNKEEEEVIKNINAINYTGELVIATIVRALLISQFDSWV